jgi:hypothetical protein
MLVERPDASANNCIMYVVAWKKLQHHPHKETFWNKCSFNEESWELPWLVLYRTISVDAPLPREKTWGTGDPPASPPSYA